MTSNGDTSVRVRNTNTGRTGIVIGSAFRWEFLVVQYDGEEQLSQVARRVLEPIPPDQPERPAPVDLTPLYVCLDAVERGTFYEDHDRATEMLSAAWRAYFDVEQAQKNGSSEVPHDD